MKEGAYDEAAESGSSHTARVEHVLAGVKIAVQYCIMHNKASSDGVFGVAKFNVSLHSTSCAIRMTLKNSKLPRNTNDSTGVFPRNVMLELHFFRFNKNFGIINNQLRFSAETCKVFTTCQSPPPASECLDGERG